MGATVYEIVTEKIVKALEAGTVPWEKLFLAHQNMISRKAYQGINALMLSMMPAETPFWLTYNQAKELGGNVKKGEKSTMIVFWKMLQKKESEETFPMLRYFNVFNASQCEGIKLPVINKNLDIVGVEAADLIVKNYPLAPKIVNGVGVAYYKPSADYVSIPQKEHFKSTDEYYSTLFHELIHSTGHKDRLNRDSDHVFGSKKYSFEELVAEIGASFLCAIAGIEFKIENRATYIASWLTKFKGDPKMIVSAASQAQKAVNYILNKQAETKAEAEKEEELVMA